MRNILSLKEGTAIQGKEIKEWINYHTINQTSHTRIARAWVRFLNIDDDKLYTINLHPSGTGCGEIGRNPIIESVEKKLNIYGDDFMTTTNTLYVDVGEDIINGLFGEYIIRIVKFSNPDDHDINLFIRNGDYVLVNDGEEEVFMLYHQVRGLLKLVEKMGIKTQWNTLK